MIVLRSALGPRRILTGRVMTSEDTYNELCYYTLSHRDPSFIHQHVVDAFAAQEADERTKPITLTFALVGLYLHVEKGQSGRQVQQAHMKLARRKRHWPTFSLPPERGTITAVDVMRADCGADRDKAIDAWCASVWDAFRSTRVVIARLVEEYDL